MVGNLLLSEPTKCNMKIPVYRVSVQYYTLKELQHLKKKSSHENNQRNQCVRPQSHDGLLWCFDVRNV